MKTTKINVSPEMAEFNDAVEMADALLDYQYDREPAAFLLSKLRAEGTFPFNAEALANAIAGIAVKR